MRPKICIVISTYNEDITNAMCNIAKKELRNSGIKKIDIVKVPGAFEIPVTISKLIKKYDSLNATFKRAEYFVNVSYDALGIFENSEEKRILQNLTGFSLNRSY